MRKTLYVGAAVVALAGVAVPRPLTIRHNEGGMIIRFAAQIELQRLGGQPVRFDGWCASACTLYLALPPEQICVTPRAKFAFHAAYDDYGTSPKMTAYMMGRYPEWVREWIFRNGGLRRHLVTMPYSYSSRFVRAC